MAIRYGDNVIVTDIVYGDGQPLRKKVVLEEEITTIPAAINVPFSYITLDYDDSHGMIYPPQTGSSGWTVGASIQSQSIVNVSTRLVSLTIFLELRIYDPLAQYPHFHSWGIIYFMLGNIGWFSTEFPMASANNGWYIGSGTAIQTVTLTQSEWNAYYTPAQNKVTLVEKIIYQENDTYVWQRMTRDDNRSHDLYIPSQYAHILNQYYPPTKVFNNKIVMRDDYDNFNEYYWDFQGYWIKPIDQVWKAVDPEWGYDFEVYTDQSFPSSSYLPNPTTQPWSIVARVRSLVQPFLYLNYQIGFPSATHHISVSVWEVTPAIIEQYLGKPTQKGITVNVYNLPEGTPESEQWTRWSSQPASKVHYRCNKT